MTKNLIELEGLALSHIEKNEFQTAAELLNELILEDPDWEHGNAQYSLACCYEELGQLQKANEHYLNALKLESKNPYFLGGYASFLELYGDPTQALETYYQYIASVNCRQSEIDDVMPTLIELAIKANMSQEIVRERIHQLIQQRR